MVKELIFLVVLDDSDEVLNALRYASQRSSINNGRVALLYTFETLEFSHWKAVEDIADEGIFALSLSLSLEEGCSCSLASISRYTLKNPSAFDCR